MRTLAEWWGDLFTWSVGPRPGVRHPSLCSHESELQVIDGRVVSFCAKCKTYATMKPVDTTALIAWAIRAKNIMDAAA